MKKINKWFWIGLLGVIIGAPNGTIIRYTVASLDPAYFNFLRFSVVVVITLPFILFHRKKINTKGLKNSFLAGLALAIAVTSYTEAIKYSQASYASLITLMSPIFFISYSVKLNNEKISRKAMAGITLSAFGAFIMVFLPVALSGGAITSQFYPLATLLLILNCASYPLAVIATKRADETEMPIIAIIGIAAMVIALINGLLVLVYPPASYHVGASGWAAIAFSAIGVGVLDRMMGVKSYEHIGAVASSALGYFGNFLSILIPILVLGEKLSLAMVGGGSLILLGIYIIEHHKTEGHKHFHGLRHH